MASEYLKWKYRDVRPDEAVELTREQRRRNWWHYHKWHVLLGVLAVCAAGDLIRHAAAQVRPDYQIAYIAAAPLSEEAETEWEARLAALGTDANGDGSILVQVNQYPTMADAGDPMYSHASGVKLMADLEDCESCFFLLEDPEAFQRGYEVLEEDWFPVGDGLYLARRSVWEDRVPDHMEDCALLWERLLEEAE